ncbi:MAG TPA: ABC transporter substrate-binding protein, partial [Acidimicrobiia bacterium]|nr:ABC transporter substrate-binding protein [Acidimicrobiia bacterium]
MYRRHPSPLELGAYFDGEPIDGVSEHIVRCRKCRESLEELRGVRSAVRGELDLTDGSARRRARWTVALIPVAAAVALLVAVSAPPGGLPVTRVENADESAVAPASVPDFAPNEPSEGATASTAPADVRTGRSAAPAAGRGTTTGGSGAGTAGANAPAQAGTDSGPSAGASGPKTVPGRSTAVAAAGSGGGIAAPPSGPLRLGVPVPTRGPSSGEGDEVLRAVRAVVDRANSNGGVSGRPVELVVVPTDDDTARADALGRVDALVGGFATDVPNGLPWVMPADVAPIGPDVAAGELAAEDAGAALGLDLAARSS